MSYKIFVTDIDGTIRTRDNMISDAVVEAIMSLEERGIPVVIASGRAAPGLPAQGRRHTAEARVRDDCNGKKRTDQYGKRFVRLSLPAGVCYAWNDRRKKEP